MTTPTPEPYFSVIDDKIDDANINHSFYFFYFFVPQSLTSEEGL